MNITIVGAGHYARDLAVGKYLSDKGCRIKAVLSPTVSAEVLSECGLTGIPLVRSPTAWAMTFGKPLASDLFDLCVHSPVLPGLVEELVRAGARNFVFPKPVALSRAGLQRIVRLKNRHRLGVVVASQWYYSDLARELRSTIRFLARGTPLERAVFDFRQSFSADQLKQYNPSNALLPHMLQIAHSTGLCRFDGKGRVHTGRPSPSSLEVTVHEKRGRPPAITFITDIASSRRQRTLALFARGCPEPVLTADFIGLPDAGRGEGHSAAWGNRQLTVWEDNLAAMVHETVNLFQGRKPVCITPLTLDNYLPVMRQQIRIEETLQRRER